MALRSNIFTRHTTVLAAVLAASMGYIGLMGSTLANAQTAQNQGQSLQTPQNLPVQNQLGQAQQVNSFSDPANVPADLARIDAALNSTQTFSGDFQIDNSGGFAKGKIFLSRPGKIRFEYEAPNPLLLVSDGVTMVQHDKDLETTDRIPLSSTPLSFFLSENVSLASDVDVIGLVKTLNDVRLSARDGSGEIEGTITMVFNAPDLRLKEWIITDSFGFETRVQLSNLSYNGRLNPRLFVFREDSRRNRRR